MTTDLPEPKSRQESYLARAAGMDVAIPDKPESRLEQYLEAIAENGGGGGGGGTTNFNQLTNRPKYNGAAMTGDTNIPQVKTYTAGSNITINGNNEISATDTTYSAFTGTDGSAAGTAGLVPAPATTDVDKFLKSDGTWDTAGGSSVTVVQSTGTSQTDVMSQNAVTSMVYNDPSAKTQIKIGNGASSNSTRTIAVGDSATASKNMSMALGNSATANGERTVALGVAATTGNNLASVALGAHSLATRSGEVNIGTGNYSFGYNSTAYRVLGGVHDPVDSHDAATKGYCDTHFGEYNIEPIANAAYENLEIPQIISTSDYEELQTAVENGERVVFMHSGSGSFLKAYCGGIDMPDSTTIALGFGSEGLNGLFDFQWNDGAPTVTFAPY